MSDIPLADSTACTKRKLGREAGSLRDSESDSVCAVYITVCLICLHAKVYKLLSLELEPQLNIAQASQTIF